MGQSSTTDERHSVPAPSDATVRLFSRLSSASVTRRWEAYRDIDWDASEHEICTDDSAWEAAAPWDPLAASPWYRDQCPARRAAIGLRRMVELLTTGIAAEAVLGQGLLRYAATLPHGHPAFRYAYHEVAEEVQHSLMFQEFVNRSGIEPTGPSRDVQRRLDRFAGFGDTSPVLFFVAALATEEAFDHVQRQVLAQSAVPPLVRRILGIHVIEEARHLSFARAVLRDVVPRLVAGLGRHEVRELRLQVPFIISWTGMHMVGHTDAFFDACDAPAEARQSIADGPLAHDMRRQGTARAASLCRDLGLVDDRIDAFHGPRLRSDP